MINNNQLESYAYDLRILGISKFTAYKSKHDKLDFLKIAVVRVVN